MRTIILATLWACSGLADAAGAPTLLWNKLSQYDLAKKSPSRDLAAFDRKVVRIPGYMIPLEVKKDQTTEFLLMPSLANCIHVPPPPANQTVHVTMDSGKKTAVTWQPIWVEGRLKISATGGDAAFELGALEIAKFDPSETKTILPAAPLQQFDCQGRDKDEAVCKSRGAPAKM